MSNPSYVCPDFTIHDSFEELKNHNNLSGFSLDKSSSGFNFKDFYHHRRAFILAEPGYGKSRVIQEIVDQADENNNQAATVSFNQLSDLNLDALETELKECKLQSTRCSIGFSLTGDANVILCLDALDEVDSSRFASALRLIDDVNKKYPAIGLYVSCRTHYVADKRYDFNRFTDFHFIRIDSLDAQQVRDFLHNELGEIPSKESIVSSIVSQSYGYDKASIFKVPRYLLDFVKAVNSRKLTQEQLLRLRRVNVLEIAIYEKLEADTNQPNASTIIKRVLEKLALVMEIAQTNQITREELITFLDRVQSNVNQALFSVCPIDVLVERVLKKTDDIVEFDNTEFQEYLAAKELLRLGERDQILYDLMVEPTFLHIYSNWYDVLRYAIELEPKTILPIANFIRQKGGQLLEEKYYRLLDTISARNLTEEEKQFIFNTFYRHYQNSPQYIGYYAELLCGFFLPANYDSCLAELPKKSNSNYFIQRYNQIAMVRALKESDNLNSEQSAVWKKRLITSAKEGDKDLQLISLSALGYFGDITALKELKEATFEQSDYDLQNEYMRACAQTNADDSFSLKVLMEGYQRGRRYADTYVQKVRQVDSLHFILDRFIENISLFESYYTGDNSHDGFQNFLYRLNEEDLKEARSEIAKKLKRLLKNLLSFDSTHHHFRYYFYDALFNIAKWLIRYESRFLFTFIDWLPERFSDDKVGKLLAKTLRPRQVKGFIERLEGHNSWLIYQTFSDSGLRDENSGGVSFGIGLSNPDKEAVRETVNKHYDNFYEKLKDTSVQDKYKEENEVKIYEQFRQQLGTSSDEYYQLNAFGTFLHNEAIVKKRATQKELDRLRSLVRDVFQYTIIENYRIRLTRVADSGRSWNLNDRRIDRYPEMLQVAQALKIDQEIVQNHRKKLLCFLPLSGKTSFFLDLLKPLSDKDKQTVIEFYENRDDDALIWAGSNFTRIIADLKLTSLIPTLKDLYKSTKVDKHLKENIVQCIGTAFAQQERDFLNAIFEKYDDGSEEDKNMAVVANECLITCLKDKSAIQWRFDQLKARRTKFHYLRSEYGGTRGVSELEIELDHLKFAKCLIGLNDLAFAEHFNDLLKFSFDIRNSSAYEAYSNYLQKVVHKFYASFTKIPTYSLKELRKQINEYPQKDVTDSFSHHLRDLELKYAGEQKKSIHQSANVYNQLQAKIYEPIHHPIELLHTILDVVGNEVTNEIQQGGLYDPIEKIVKSHKSGRKTETGKAPHVNEDLIQKMLKLSLENNLQKRGFRSSDILIDREVELYDGKRFDLLIKYGFVAPVMVEIKLENNDEIRLKKDRKKYKEKIQQYLHATPSKLGLYLVFKVKPNSNDHFTTLRREYSDIEGLHFKQIDCTKSFSK